jgi:hypothetical protein
VHFGINDSLYTDRSTAIYSLWLCMEHCWKNWSFFIVASYCTTESLKLDRCYEKLYAEWKQMTVITMMTTDNCAIVIGGEGHLVCLLVVCLMTLSVPQSLWPNFKVWSWHLPEGAEEHHRTLKIASAKIRTRNFLNTSHLQEGYGTVGNGWRWQNW